MMKKIYFILLTFVMSLLLVGCTVSNDDLFKEYLNNQEPLTAAKLDEMFAEVEPISLPENLFSGLKVANTKIEVESDVNRTIYVWQNGEKIYLDAIIEEESETLYFDLPMFEQLYDEAISQLPITDTSVKPSELYAQLVQAQGDDLGALANKSLDEILDVLNFEYDDFELVEEGKYKVKDEVLYAKILVFTIENITVEDLIELLTQAKTEIALYVYFDGLRINSYELITKNAYMEQSVKITLLYNELELNGIKLNVAEGQNLIDLEIKLVDEVLTASFQMNSQFEGNANATLTLSKNELTLLVKQGELVMAKADLDFGMTEENVYYLSGLIEVEEEKITITKDIVIGDDLKAKEETAINMYEYFG